MKRFRWFQAEWPVTIRALAKKIKLLEFDDDTGHSFFIDRVRDDYLEARYVERVNFSDVVVDPFGKEIKFDRVEFRQTQFCATSYAPGLELINPPRNFQALMNRLSEAADFEVAITPVVINVTECLDTFQKLANISLIVDSIQIGAFQIEPNVTAKIVIKGDKDVRSAYSSLTKGKKAFTLEKIQVRLKPPFRGTMVISSAGTASLSSEELLDQIMSHLRSSLIKSVHFNK